METTMEKPPALTADAQAASSINDKHREVQRLGRTAKEIAAEIGEELIKVKASLQHGEFTPWVEENCSFTKRMAQNYIKISDVKNETRFAFDQCDSIREVLTLGKPKPAPKQERRAATLNDLRKVERLRALRDDPATTAGEKANAQRKLDEIEAEIGPRLAILTGHPPVINTHLRIKSWQQATNTAKFSTR